MKALQFPQASEMSDGFVHLTEGQEDRAPYSAPFPHVNSLGTKDSRMVHMHLTGRNKPGVEGLRVVFARVNCSAGVLSLVTALASPDPSLHFSASWKFAQLPKG